MKVLLFSNDLMPFGELPTSGGGLRCWQLKRGLESHGIEVVSSMPGFTYLTEQYFDKIPEAQREWLWRWETQDEILRQVKPDAVLFASNWDHFNLSSTPDIPLIIDLHGSRLIETRMFNDPASADRKVSIISKADCLLCAGTRQRMYFYGWLMQAGRVPKDDHFIRYIPVSLSPELPPHEYPSHNDSEAPLIVSGGGWFPWQNQSKSIFAVCKAVMERSKGSIEIFGTPHETSTTLSPEEMMIREVYENIKSFSEKTDRIRVNGYIGRDSLLKIYGRASVALEAMQYNLERELAFTTRTIEYLWCGLPVLYNDFGEISEHIRDYDAGWTIDPENETDIAQAVDQMFSDPAAVEQKGKNARRLVVDRFSWDKTIQPLVDFLNNPQKASLVEPVLGPVPPRASFLSPSGTAVDVPLAPSVGSLCQEFIVPAENIKTIEVPVALSSLEDRSEIESLELRLSTVGGRCVAKKRIPASEIPLSGKATIDFPMWCSPSGGDEFEFSMKLTGRSGADADSLAAMPLVVKGFLETGYPFTSRNGSSFVGRTLLGEQVKVRSLALSFIPGGGKLYRLKSLSERVLVMVRQRQWRRLWKAGVRRVPGLVYRVKRLAFG